MDQINSNKQPNEEQVKKLVETVLEDNKELIDINVKLIQEAQNNLRKIYRFQYDNLYKKCSREIDNLKSISKSFEEIPLNFEIDTTVNYHKRNTILDQYNVCKVLNEGNVGIIIRNFEDEIDSFTIANYNSLNDCIKYEYNDYEKKKCILKGFEMNFKILRNEIKTFYKELNSHQLI